MSSNLEVLFDRASGGVPDGAARVAELMLWALTAEGTADEPEIDRVASVFRRGSKTGGIDDAKRILDALATLYRTEDAINSRVHEIAAGIPGAERRRAAYQLAVWSAAPDGHVSEEQALFLEELQDHFELDDDAADALFYEAVQ